MPTLHLAEHYREELEEKVFFMFLEADIQTWSRQIGHVAPYPAVQADIDMMRENAKKVIELWTNLPDGEMKDRKLYRTLDIGPPRDTRGAPP